MVRRTKEDALATRSLLLDTAERVFAEQGVSRTSLSDIAQAAGVSRGAIYWHFKNKADLFNAMMDRLTLPMEAAFAHLGQGAEADPLDDLRGAMMDAMRQVAGDARTRRVFEVATHKVEYVDELLAVKARHLQSQQGCVRETAHALLQAAKRRAVIPAVPPVVAAQGLHALAVGLIQTWLLDPDAFDLVATAQQALEAYLKGLGFAPASGA